MGTRPLGTAAREVFSGFMRTHEGLATMEPKFALPTDWLRASYRLVAGIVPLQQLGEGSGVVEVAPHLGHRGGAQRARCENRGRVEAHDCL